MKDVIGLTLEGLKEDECDSVSPQENLPDAIVLGPEVLIFRENVASDRLRRVVRASIGSTLLVASLPILLVASACIYLEDGGPVFFCQRRVGRFGRLFTMYKLRTMRKENCVDRPSPTSGKDPRITWVGHWLRRSSIDELPQLINIIRGEMAFVGPRPEMPFLVRRYEDWQHLRHLVTPGITGLWQVMYRKSLPLQLPAATVIDIQYVNEASFLTDAVVLAKTLREVIYANGAF